MVTKSILLKTMIIKNSKNVAGVQKWFCYRWKTSILKSYCQGLLAFILYTKIVAVKGGRKKRELVPENLWDFLEDLDINLIHGKCMLF